MQRFQERVGTLIVTELGQDCPAMVVSQNTALVAAVQAEDEAYRTITRSPLSDQIAEADQVRDNTFVGLRTMVEALGRVGAGRHGAGRSAEDREPAGADAHCPAQRAAGGHRRAGHAEGPSGGRPGVCGDGDGRQRLRRGGAAAGREPLRPRHRRGESGPGVLRAAGWTVTADDEVLFQQRRLLDKQGAPVDAATKVEAGQYSLEAEAQDGGDVTPVTPE